VVTVGGPIGGFVDVRAEERESVSRLPADLGRVLAHAAREHEHVDTPQCGGHRPHVSAQPVQIDVDRQPGVVVAALGGSEDMSHGSVAGQTEQSRLVLQRVGQLGFRERLAVPTARASAAS